MPIRLSLAAALLATLPVPALADVTDADEMDVTVPKSGTK